MAGSVQVSVEHLTAEHAVEPLVISILPWRAREDLDRLDQIDAFGVHVYAVTPDDLLG